MSTPADAVEEFNLGAGVAGLRLTTRDGTVAEIARHGAHMLRWQPAGHQPVLWVSNHSWFQPGRPIRGGIPICFPWFGAHPSDSSQPAHGTVRLQPWNLSGTESTSQGELVDVCLERAEGPFQLEYRVRIGRELKCSLRVHLPFEATQEATCEAALHTYLAVSDIRTVEVRGLESLPYLNKVPGQADGGPAGQPITFSGETDRIYQHSDHSVSIVDSGWRRMITISKSGSLSTVVWNPWIDKSRRMPDFGDDEWTGMLCVETAAVGSCRLSLRPGQSHTLQAVIAVRHT
ncbi:MAG: D-hexose-6-phosphate mutarotase [Planctomycetota bacterium]